LVAFLQQTFSKCWKTNGCLLKWLILYQTSGGNDCQSDDKCKVWIQVGLVRKQKAGLEGMHGTCLGQWWQQDSIIKSQNHYSHFLHIADFLVSKELTTADHKIHTASHTYVHVLSLCHLYSFTGNLKSHKHELPKDTFLMHSSHNFTPKRNELIYHCSLSQLYFTGH
jgi:hypothetical protein